MDKGQALDLINDLSGNEYNWVDFKVDYEIGGIPSKKAEFVRDVSSMANTLSEQENHYIIVGVQDDGELVGLDEDREEYRGAGPRHIFSYDDSKIQQKIDSNLSPSPSISWSTYQENSEKFGILEIEPLDSPPCVTTRHIQEDDTRYLHEGLIFIRNGSSKKIAGREEIQEMFKHHVEKQRETILEGITKAIQIGPEWIERLGSALPDDKGVPFTSVENSGDADLEIKQRLTRSPASTLDEGLNGDIAQWKYRGDDFIESKPLWDYYASPNTLTLDKTALLFLTHASVKNSVLGGFWFVEAEEQDQEEILLNGKKTHHCTEKLASLTLLLDDEDLFDELIDSSNTSSEYGYLSTCERKFGNTIADRLSHIMKDTEYRLSHDTWRRNFNVRNQSVEDIKELVPGLAEQLVDIEERMGNGRGLRGRRERFKNALWDLEAVYVGKVLGGY